MKLKNRFRDRSLAIAGVMCLITGVATAQDLDETGVVRISDLSATTTSQSILPTTCDQVFNSGCADSCVPGNLGACISDQHTGLFGGCPKGLRNHSPNGLCPGCPNCRSGLCQLKNGKHCKHGKCRGGYGCPGQSCGNGCGNGCGVLYWLGFCGTGADCNTGCGPGNGCLSQSARRLLAWIDPCSTTCSYSPMHGFNPPNKRPYFRQPISYQHNYPASWVGGKPSGYHGHRPAVYMPTDTTQLGYYYQKVPTWVPVPGMIPPAPQPTQWHYYGSTDFNYTPYQGVQYEGAENEDAADDTADDDETPVPPMPEEQVEMLNLERTASSPRLLPILQAN